MKTTCARATTNTPRAWYTVLEIFKCFRGSIQVLSIFSYGDIIVVMCFQRVVLRSLLGRAINPEYLNQGSKLRRTMAWSPSSSYGVWLQLYFLPSPLPTSTNLILSFAERTLLGNLPLGDRDCDPLEDLIHY